MPSKHTVTGSSPVGEAKLDPKGGNGYPTEKYPSGEMVYATDLGSVEKQGS